ncbi:MAG TPA: histidine kinase [Terriglobales bacterium]|jgi:two-component system LytT family sensor kinase|nr:histidine kinase [Terriglobales bacterium]
MDLAPDEPECQRGKRAKWSRNQSIAVHLLVPEKQILDLECDDDVESARGVLTVSRKLIPVTSLGGRPIRWLAYLAGWTLFAFFFIGEDAGRLLLQRQPVQWRGLLVVWLTTAYAWAFFTPFVWRLARRFPFERKNWRLNIGLHLVSSFSFALIETVLFSAITPVFGLPWFPRNFAATFQAVLLIDFHLNVIVYWSIVGIQHGVSYYRKFEEREKLSAQLENQLAQARLSALKMQLHPHFLFNTLNAIVVLVRQHRAGEADEMLTNLSELLRQTLEGWETQEVPLRREIELITSISTSSGSDSRTD